MKTQFINQVLTRMNTVLDTTQIQMLENTMVKVLQSYEMVAAENALATIDRTNEMLLKEYIMDLQLSGRSKNTIKAYQQSIKKFLEILNDKNILQITANDIKAFLYCYMETGVSKVTVLNAKRNISAFFNWLFVNEYIEKNPMLKVNNIKCNTKVKPPLNYTEIEMIRRWADNNNKRYLIEFMLDTGCRVGEVHELNISDVDFIQKSVKVHGKGDKERIVYMHDNCIFYLKEYIENRQDTCEALFVNSHDGRISVDTVQGMCRKITSDLKFSEAVTPHRFRRTFATNCIKRGMALQTLQYIMGHTSPTTTMEYVSIYDENIKSEFMKL